MKQAQILMCPPDYYGIEYEINPWMSRSRGSSPERARAQWDALYQTLRRLGAAVKLMAGPIEAPKDDALMRRFEREAQVTGMLTSPHAVRVFDYGMSNDGALYFAMEMLEGRDAEDRKLGMVDAAHLFASSTTRIGLRRRAWLRGYVYAFIEGFAPHLTRRMVEQALAGGEGGADYQL